MSSLPSKVEFEYEGYKVTINPVQAVLLGSVLRDARDKSKGGSKLVELFAFLFKNVEVRKRNKSVVFRLLEPCRLTLTIFASGRIIVNNVEKIEDFKRDYLDCLARVYSLIYSLVKEVASDDYVRNVPDTKIANRRMLINTLAKSVFDNLVAPDELMSTLTIKNIVANVTIEPGVDKKVVASLVDYLRRPNSGFTIKHRERFPAVIVEFRYNNRRLDMLLFSNMNMVISNVKDMKEAEEITRMFLNMAFKRS